MTQPLLLITGATGAIGKAIARQIAALPPLAVDDLVALLDTGAYGAVMASNYNRRLLAPEVLVDEGRAVVIRRRQTLDDVLALEA